MFSYRCELACNINKMTARVQDKVIPLEDSAGYIISQGFLMAENLNGYFSSVYTRILVDYQFQMLNFRRLNLTI